MRTGWSSLMLMLVCGTTFAADEPLADLNLEAHGFVSFGYLKTWGNNWHGDTLDGTDEFWEAGANFIARPIDRVRIGAQLFARDLGIYGNGKAYLDWAYIDYRFADPLGLQVGRVKVPFGLYGEAQDVDSARTPVFLPRMYPTRAREVIESTDGAKAYGSINDFDWALYAGQKQFQTDGDFANYFSYALNLNQITDIGVDLFTGGMVHWHTPITGLDVRVSGFLLDGISVSGVQNGSGDTVDFSAEEWWAFTGGVIYDWSQFTFTGEYLRFQSPQTITFMPSGGGPGFVAESVLRDEHLTLATTWHARPWLDLYGCGQAWWSDPTDRWDNPYNYGLVAAIDIHPLRNWSIKVEFQQCWGINDVDATLNPDGIKQSWQVLALKTTVDF